MRKKKSSCCLVMALRLTLTAALLLPSYGFAAPSPDVFRVAADNQLGLTFSPDGSVAFWVAWNGIWGSSDAERRSIYRSQLQNAVWSEPTLVALSGNRSDDDPFVSPDGRWLYFVSDRPTSTDDESTDTNIWRLRLRGDDEPELVPVNSKASEFSPIVVSSGAIYFASDRNGGPGAGDLYRASPEGDGFVQPEVLGAAFNTPTGEWNLWVSPDEREIIFEASSRRTNVSVPGDLYYSWNTAAGWTAATPILQLNSAGSDLMPRVHPDGETLYYASSAIGGHADMKSVNWTNVRSELRDDYAPTLLVANRSSHEVTFVNLAHGAVVKRIDTGEGPHLLSNVDNGRVLATGYGEFPRPHSAPVSKRPPFVTSLNSRATLIDTQERSILLDTALNECSKPHASLLVDHLGFVTCEEEQYVLAIAPSDGATVGRFDTLQEGSHVLSFDPTTRILATSNTGSGSVTLINIDTRETRVVELSAGSEGALIIGNLLWIGNGVDGSISIVDVGSADIVGHIDDICSFPIALATNSENSVWVACFASSELVAMDRNDFSIQQRIETRDQPLNLLLHPTRALAYVSLPRQNAVAEIDLESGQEIRRIEVGIEPDGLRWAE